MPIGFIAPQPDQNSINAAYRPIILRVQAVRTDGAAIPPVVYCDVYINGIFYRSLSKTQFDSTNGVNSEWEFDIQDCLQEYLGKYIADNGTDDIMDVTELIAQINCRFRSSGYDVNGFLKAEDLAPIQGTDNVAPTPGTGKLSHIFYVVNVALQHEDNADLRNHLSYYRYRTWDDNAFPLTHRPDKYFICRDDSDSYPIISEKIPTQIVLHYQLKGSSTWLNSTFSLPCDAAELNGIALTLPDAAVGVPYLYSIGVQGTPPFALTNVVKPAWMTITLSSTGTLTFSGTPADGDDGINKTVSFTVDNCASNHLNLIDHIDVTNCQIVALVTDPLVVPNGTLNSPYDLLIPLKGTPAYLINISSLIKPAWATVEITGSNLHISGTPPTGGNHHFLIEIANCGGTLGLEFDLNVPTGPATYGDPAHYTIAVQEKINDCTLVIVLHRDATASADSGTDNKTVRVHYHAVADNGCSVDNFRDMAPTDGLEIFNQDVLCGRGPCGSFANVFITSIDIL